jgi:antitoxin VapB
MAHALNVKNPEAHRLAQAIAALTGDTLTDAVTDALRERLDSLQRRKRKASVQEMLSIADRIATHVRVPYVDHGELLYDEQGLPK